MRPVPGRKIGFPVRRGAVLVLMAVAFAGTGCGETVIDDTKIEDTIRADVEKTRDEEVKAVDCPEPEVDPGKTFTCAVEYPEGKQATITLKIRNEDADLDVVGFKFND